MRLYREQMGEIPPSERSSAEHAYLLFYAAQNAKKRPVICDSRPIEPVPLVQYGVIVVLIIICICLIILWFRAAKWKPFASVRY
jgi:hypothetical protein